MFGTPVTSPSGGPTVELQIELMPAEDPNYLARRDVVRAIADVRRRLELAPEFSLRRQLVPAGELLLQLAQACGLSQLEHIEALGAALWADLAWPEEMQP